MEDKETIIKRGWVEVHVVSAGMRQRHMLNVRKEKTMWGTVPFLVTQARIPHSELLRLAEELQLPVQAGGLKVFPRGKSPKDFVVKDEGPKIKIE